jgi:hypothetical protein
VPHSCAADSRMNWQRRMTEKKLPQPLRKEVAA